MEALRKKLIQKHVDEISRSAQILRKEGVDTFQISAWVRCMNIMLGMDDEKNMAFIFERLVVEGRVRDFQAQELKIGESI